MPRTSMGLLGGIINGTSSPCSSSSSPSVSPNYLDPRLQVQPSFPTNPSSVHQVHINKDYTNPFLQASNHDLQNQSTCSSEVVVFQPEPLSLFLSSHYNNNTHHQNQTNLPLELHLRMYGPTIYDDKVTWSGGYMVVPSGSTSNEISRSSVPLGPFSGYVSILKESKFLKPAQQLLEELFCGVGGGEWSSFDASVMDPPLDQCLSVVGLVDDPLISSKKSKLILMLEEVYKRYKQYYQQIQSVVASFECVAGLGNAAPYANLALKATSKHFKSLKNSIYNQLQLQLPNKAYGQLSHEKEAMNFSNIDRGPGGQRLVKGPGFAEQRPVWRPQRGLPEQAVAILRTWLFEHFLHPYPTDTDKLLLAKQTGLTRNQVSNWFINARVRLWKPLVDEIHTLETQQAGKDSEREELNTSRPSNQVLGANLNALSNLAIPTPRIQDVTPKCTRNELSDLHVGGERPLNLSYNNLSGHSQMGGVALSMAGGSSGVSLTLGLHQNNGLGITEPYPSGAAHHIGDGLDANNEGYVIGGYQAQNRQFGRDVIRGQLFA